jgi:hypothetical protein
VKHALAVFAALFLAIHVSVGPVPAPVPVLLALGAVIGTLVFMIAGQLARDGLFPRWGAGA